MTRKDIIVLAVLIAIVSASVVALWKPAIRPALEYLSGNDVIELTTAEAGNRIIYHDLGDGTATLRVETVSNRDPYRILALCSSLTEEKLNDLRRAGEEMLRYHAETARLTPCPRAS